LLTPTSGSISSTPPSEQQEPSPQSPHLIRAAALIKELEKRERWQRHPIDYCVERLGVKRESLDWALLPAYQGHRWDGTENPIAWMFECLATNRWAAVEGATGTSKTFAAACATFWFLECFDDSVVITTAPKAQQLSLHIWKEIGKMYPRFARGELLQGMLRMNPPRDDWEAVAFVAGVRAEEAEASATKAQGFHAEHMLIITEETPGISEAVMSALQNTSIAPHNLILALGNPDHQFDTLHKFALQKTVEHIVISGFDCPNVVLKDPNFIPGGQSEEGLRRMLDKYKSPEHPLYQSRARGRSPQQPREALIRWDWLVAARDRKLEERIDKNGLRVHVPKEYSGYKALGVDVANSEEGDKAAIAEGVGSVCLKVTAEQCPDANLLGDHVAARIRSESINPACVGVDGVGVGAGTVNELKRQGITCIDIQSGETAEPVTDRGVEMVESFNNLRSQMWWQLRVDLQDPHSTLCLPDDEELYADLMMQKWEPINGKIVVQSKRDVKKKLGRSPNKGDALVYWNWVRSRRQVEAAAPETTVQNENDTKRTQPDRGENPFAATRRRTW
jgi:hypothetical protein